MTSKVSLGQDINFHKLLAAVHTGLFNEKLVIRVEKQLQNLSAPKDRAARAVLLDALGDRVKKENLDLVSMLSKDVQKGVAIAERILKQATSQRKQPVHTEKSHLIDAPSVAAAPRKDYHSIDETEENLFSKPNLAERYLLEGGDFEVLLTHFNARVEEIENAVCEEDETTRFGYSAFAYGEMKKLIDRFQNLRHAASSMSYAASYKIVNPGKAALQEVLTRADEDIMAALSVLTTNAAMLSVFHRQRLADEEQIAAPKKGWSEEALESEAQIAAIDYDKVIDIRLFMLNGIRDDNYDEALKKGASLKPYTRAFTACVDHVKTSNLNRDHKILLIDRMQQRYIGLVMAKQEYYNAKDFNRCWWITGIGFLAWVGLILFRTYKEHSETDLAEAQASLTMPQSHTAVINTEEQYQRLMTQYIRPKKGIGTFVQQHSQGKPLHPRILAIKLGAL